MRRQGGNYGSDSGGSHQAYGGATSQMHQQQQNNHGRHQEPLPLAEKEGHQHHNQWRRERDGSQSKLPQAAMSPTPSPFTEGQAREAPRSYYQNQRLDPRMPLEKQGGADRRSQPHEENMDIGYDDNHVPPSFEGLEQRFLDDIMKLSKDQTDAENAENARHKQRINIINTQYEEQLIALRARHAGRREDFLRGESQARHQQYQQIATEKYPNSGISPSDDPSTRGYNNAGTAPTAPQRAYNSDYYDSYRERGRFPGNAKDHNFEPKVPYPRGRSYDTGPHHY